MGKIHPLVRTTPKPGSKTAVMYAWLQKHAPARATDIASGIGSDQKQVCALLSQNRDKYFRRTEDGRYEIFTEGASKPSADGRRGASQGSLAQAMEDAGMLSAMTSSAEAHAANAAAAELVVAGRPLSLTELVRATKFRRELVAESLKEKRFQKTADGYRLTPVSEQPSRRALRAMKNDAW